jgi:transposase
MEYFCRRKGWAVKGKTVEIETSGLRFERRSICSLFDRRKLFEPIIYQGMADKNLVLTYFRAVLPKLPENSMIVMDNASWHKSKELQDVFDEFKVELMFQPPYSPDLNSIERIWGTIKSDLRNCFDTAESLFENLCRVVSSRMGDLESLGVG